jgi:hypothetical protein
MIDNSTKKYGWDRDRQGQQVIVRYSGNSQPREPVSRHRDDARWQEISLQNCAEVRR